MKRDLSSATVAFAREYGAFTTPAVRSQGWAEQGHEVRGEGDVMDLVGSLTLCAFLVEQGLPATFQMTANEGDDADLIVTTPAGPVRVNVKTSRYEWEGSPDPTEAGNHLHFKEEELGKALPDAFAQVFVYLRPRTGEPRAHLAEWVLTASEAFRSQRVRGLSGTGGQRGLRIHRRDLVPLDEVVGRLRRRTS